MAEHLMGGYTAKIVQGGQGASAGVTAAGLAAAGITGAPYALEGSSLGGGFTHITSGGKPSLERIAEGLGETYAIQDIYFKPYTACRHTHGGAQAALELTSQRRIDPAEIEKVEVHTYGIAAIAVGKGVSAGDSFVSAQFSLPYVVAAALSDGEMGPAQLTEQRVADPDLLGLSKKVEVQVDQKLNDEYPEFTASRVEITFRNGEKIARQVDVPKGDPRDPMKADDLAAKLARFAPRRDEKDLAGIVETIAELETVDHIGELTSLV
jgi:2-methylcitrate dehydratase PrpD